MSSPYRSVAAIIPTYNGISRGYLAEAIQSIYKQTRLPDEIIVVNDGSTDNTECYVRAHFPNIKIVTTKNQGLPAARNTGINAAVSDLITFLDDDDIWTEDKIEVQLNVLEKFSSELRKVFVISPYTSLKYNPNTNEWMLGKTHNPIPSLLSWPGCVLGNGVTSPSSVMIPKNLIVEAGGFDPTLKIGEDYEFWIRLFINGIACQAAKKPLVKYRIHAQQMSADYLKSIEDVWGIQKKYLQMMPSRHRLLSFTAIFANHMALLLLKREPKNIARLFISRKKLIDRNETLFFLILPAFLLLETLKVFADKLGPQGSYNRVCDLLTKICFKTTSSLESPSTPG